MKTIFKIGKLVRMKKNYGSFPIIGQVVKIGRKYIHVRWMTSEDSWIKKMNPTVICNHIND